MPRKDRARHEQGRSSPIPPCVHAVIDAVNDAGRDDWHRLMEALRLPRDAEYRHWTTHDQAALAERFSVILAMGPEADDPPAFEDAAIWLLSAHRDVDLCRCLECRRWFLARHNRTERCGAVACRRAENRKRQARYRQELFGAD